MTIQLPIDGGAFQEVMEQYPALGYGGFHCRTKEWFNLESLPQDREELTKSDPKLLNAIHTLLTYPYMHQTPHICNKGTSSYGLKHIVERILGQYVSNGQHIAAALMAGWRCKVRTASLT